MAMGLGGGAELAVACDMRLMASHARLGFIQGRMGITSAWGGGPDLNRADRSGAGDADDEPVRNDRRPAGRRLGGSPNLEGPRRPRR
jgi:hypothetical protein